MSNNEVHYHICEMHLRIKTCQVKITKCENMEANGECLQPATHGTCDNYECKITRRLDEMKIALEECKTDNAKLKALNTNYRLLFMTPLMTQEAFDKNRIDFSGIDSLIKQRRETYETCDITTILYLIELHKRIIDDYFQFVQEKLGKIQVDTLDKQKKKETAKAMASIEKAKEEAKAAKKEENKPKTPYEKMVRDYMKLGMPLEVAEKTVQAMGMKP